MNSTNPLTHYPLHRFTAKTPPLLLQPPLKLRFHCSMPRPPNRSRRKPRRFRLNIPSEPSSSSSSLSTSSDAKLQTVIDLDQLYFSSRSRFHQFLAAGEDAYRDLQTLITFDTDRRLVVSCRRSTLRFVGDMVVLGCVVVLGFRVLVGLLRLLGSRGGYGSGSYKPVVRRDRSLGGREVVVGTTVKTREEFNARKGFGALSNPLSPAMEELVSGSMRVSNNWVRGEKKLPKWWPNSVPNSGFPVDMQEEYQREANRLIRGWF